MRGHKAYDAQKQERIQEKNKKNGQKIKNKKLHMIFF